ncbi:beta-lactamase family protein [bacterium]|nr:beta-lactamase family protein [bacterium]
MNKALSHQLQQGLSTKTYQDAELIVSQNGNTVFHEYVGQQHKMPRYFDLASLTKPLCTALVTLKLYQDGKISFTQKISDFFPTSIQPEKTIASLLNHTSGFVDWQPFYKTHINKTHNREIVTQDILEQLLNDKGLINPTGVCYSDLGFILLGFILEKITNTKLNILFQNLIAKPLKLQKELLFSDNKQNNNFFVPSAHCPYRKHTLRGDVMDLNATVLDGIAGHAGLFGTAEGINFLLIELRKALQGKSSLFEKQKTEEFLLPNPNRSHAQRYFTLGFDTPTKDISQSGTLFSKNSIGHLGFTGTSFWWDLDNDFWVILLTNRHLGDDKNKLKYFRPQLHDFIINNLGLKQ